MKIHIPSPLRVYSDKQDTVSVHAATVGEALEALTVKHPDLKKHLYSEEGKLRSFVNVYLNDEDIRYLPEKDATKVGEQDALSIIPSIAGGTGRRTDVILSEAGAVLRLRSRRTCIS
jgi:molybdopterin converting factor small subunit